MVGWLRVLWHIEWSAIQGIVPFGEAHYLLSFEAKNTQPKSDVNNFLNKHNDHALVVWGFHVMWARRDKSEWVHFSCLPI